MMIKDIKAIRSKIPYKVDFNIEGNKVVVVCNHRRVNEIKKIIREYLPNNMKLEVISK